MKVLAIFDDERCSLIVDCPKHEWVINGAWDIQVDLPNKTFYCVYTRKTHSFDYAEEIEVRSGGHNDIMYEIHLMEIPETDRYKKAINDNEYGLGFNIL